MNRLEERLRLKGCCILTKKIEEKTDPRTGLAIIPESDTLATARYSFEIGIPELRIVKEEKIEIPLSELKVTSKESKSSEDKG